MSDLLLELYSEEIPASLQRKAATDLSALLMQTLKEVGLSPKEAQEYSTPRRLTIHIRGMHSSTPDREEELKGPSTNMPEQAIQGFLRKAGLSCIQEASICEDPKGKGSFYQAKILHRGEKAVCVLSRYLPILLSSLAWPKSMRWGNQSSTLSSFKWIRPLRSILCILEEEGVSSCVDFAIGEIRSGNTTYGHRFHAPEIIKVNSFQTYKDSLSAAKIILCPMERKAKILEQAHTLAEKEGLVLFEDETLLDEVVGLVEWPVVFLGKFDPVFLSLPFELVQSTVRINQKSFVLKRVNKAEQGRPLLSNHFIGVSNIEAKDQGKAIQKGNEKVIHARLSDALYFWKKDQEDFPDRDLFYESAKKLGLDLNKMLDQRMAKLDHMGIVFHTRLGTQGARVARICDLAKSIGSLFSENLAYVHRACVLAKADLLTCSVSEFPELQGIMGREYALLQGEDPRVADALRDHYKPRGAFDTVPKDLIAICVSLADRIDMLVGFCMAGEWPTGSRDPYGVRRAALGILRLLLDNHIHFPLRPFLSLQIERIAQEIFPPIEKNNPFDAGDFLETIMLFLQERLKVYLHSKGMRFDLIDAALSLEGSDFLLVQQRVQVLESFLNTQKGQNLYAALKRVFSIIQAEEKKGYGKAKSSFVVKKELLAFPEEKDLFLNLLHVEEKIKQIKEMKTQEGFSQSLEILCSLSSPIHSFFEKILINDPNEDIRHNRLTLLEAIGLLTKNLFPFRYLKGEAL